MQNEPNFKNSQMNVTFVITKEYENKRPYSHRQNEPNTNPILSTGLSIDQFEQNMQNEPNLQNTQINVTSVKTKNYENKRPFSRWQNEPNTNPILRKTNPIEPGAKVYTDKDDVIEKVPAELAGLNALRIKSSAPYSISFSCDEPVRVFAFLSLRSWEAWGKLPRYDDGSKEWTLYAPQAAVISKRTYDIYYRDFDAGKVTIQYDKKPFSILGITKKDIKLVPEVHKYLNQKIFNECIPDSIEVKQP